MAREVQIRRGDTLLLQLTVLADDGVPIDLTNLTLASQVRDAQDNLVATLSVVASTVTGVATITQRGTALWPVGTLRADIKAITTGGVIVHSETFGIRVQRSVTA